MLLALLLKVLHVLTAIWFISGLLGRWVALGQVAHSDNIHTTHALIEMRKRVMLQAAWSSGCSIFAYPVLSKTDEHTKQEIMALYRELAKLVMEWAAEGGTHHG